MKQISNNQIIHYAIASVFFCLASVPAIAQIKGAVPARAFDLQKFVDSALAAGKTTIVVPPGRYAVAPYRGQHLWLHDLHGVSIDASNVEMVCTQTTRAISFDRCSDTRLNGLTIDYDPLPFTEGRITAVAPDRSWLEFTILDGYSDQKLETRVEIYDPTTGLLKTTTYYGWKPFESLGHHHYRVAKGASYHWDPKAPHEDVGDILVTNNVCAPDGSQPHAIVSTDCANLRLENVTLYASNCFGFLEYSCKSTTYLRCGLDRRPLSSDPVRRSFARMRSTDADAYHSEGAIVGPQIIDCVAKFQGDDCVNIHGTYQMVSSAQGPELRILSSRKPDLKPGDPLQLLTYDGHRPSNAKLLGIKPDGHITADERAFLMLQQMNQSIKTSQLTQAYQVVLDRAVELPRGSVLCSESHIGNGFQVTGCDFGFNRSRGILIKASDGQIANNRITGTWGAAIQVQPEVWWLEAGSSSNLTIEGNRISDCRTIAVDITAVGCGGTVAPPGAHRNLTLANNTILNGSLPNILITSTDGLRISGTIAKPAPGSSVSVGRLKALHLNAAMPSVVMTADCSNVQLAPAGQ